MTGKTQKPSLWDYVEVLKDVRVVVMIMQYSACFGTELAMNNQLVSGIQDYYTTAVVTIVVKTSNIMHDKPSISTYGIYKGTASKQHV